VKIRIGSRQNPIELEGEPEELQRFMDGSSEIQRLVKAAYHEETSSWQSAGTIKLGTEVLPSGNEIIDYIERKGEPFEHNMGEIMLAFFGKLLDSRLDSKNYDALYRRIRTAHKYLAQKYGGHFKSSAMRVTVRENGNASSYTSYKLKKLEQKIHEVV